ncbi:MAG: FAD-dependent oxidoreductase [Candidatus Methylomirabilia bacterium]
MTMAVRFIILGGGVSGLAAAWRLAERGFEVDVLEADFSVGGLAGTRTEGDCYLDLGAHSFFSDDREIERAVLALFAHPPAARLRTVKLFYEGRFIDYPLTARSALLQMGLLSGIRAAASFVKEKLRPRPPHPAAGGEETVEDWAIGHFGEHLYRTFFKPYTEQFWKIPCAQLSSNTIPAHTRMSFTATLRLLLQRKTNRGKASLVEREMLPTYSPERGFFEIAEGLAARVRKGEGRIHLGCQAARVEALPEGGVRVTYRCGGTERQIEGDHVISTVPLPLLIGMLGPAVPTAVREAAGRLEYRSLVALGMLTRKPRVLGCGYVYQLNRPYNRLFEMNDFSPRSSPPGYNIVGAEIPCIREDADWSATKEELFEKCIGDLAADGFLARDDVERLLLAKAPHAYPVYRNGYAPHLRCVLGYLEDLAYLTTLGRSGEFRYMDIDQCLRRAFDLVDGRFAALVA